MRSKKIVKTLLSMRALFFVAVAFLLVFQMQAQTSSGSISGAIVDATHSAVPNAAVTATEQDKKFTLNAKTDNAGRFANGECGALRNDGVQADGEHCGKQPQSLSSRRAGAGSDQHGQSLGWRTGRCREHLR